MLEVRNVCAGYGSVPVLHDIDLQVQAGEIVLVIGENGAGKSTLLRTIGGFIRPTEGRVLLAGQDVTGEAPEQLVRRGLRLVLDGHRVFPALSTFDNLRLGAVARGGVGGEFQRALDEILAVFPILAQKLHAPARDLSGGQQQMLALGQAFLARPTVLLCDEPSTGLAQALMPPILSFFRTWAASGTGIVLVEQHIDLALPVADRIVLVERGRIAMSCPAREFEERQRGEALSA